MFLFKNTLACWYLYIPGFDSSFRTVLLRNVGHKSNLKQISRKERVLKIFMENLDALCMNATLIQGLIESSSINGYQSRV